MTLNHHLSRKRTSDLSSLFLVQNLTCSLCIPSCCWFNNMPFLVSGIFVLLICHSTFAQSGSEMVSSSTNNLTTALSPTCNVTCTNFVTMADNCNLPHCGCNTEYIEAQGNCLLCLSNTSEDQALSSFLLNEEAAQCQRDGFSVSFSLNLTSPAEAFVQMINRQSADLRRNQAVFLALQIIGGHIGLPAILIFALYSSQVRQVHRDPTFLNFCITWIFSSVVFSLLLYRGRADNTIFNPVGEVESNICIAQAVLTEGAQLMTASSTLSLIIRLWLGFRAVLHEDDTCNSSRTVGKWTIAALVITPYLCFLVSALVSVFMGIGQVDAEGLSPNRVSPTYFYCTIIAPKATTFIQAVYGLTLVFVILSMGFNVHIISILYRHWRSFQHTKPKSAVSHSLLLRMVFFSTYQIVVAVADSIVLRRSPKILLEESSVLGLETLSRLDVFLVSVWIDMLQAAIPLVGTLVLGITSEMVTSFVKLFLKKDLGLDDVEADASTSLGHRAPRKIFKVMYRSAKKQTNR